ncbi:hypothetical protein [Streptomyces brasiliensis]|uniref:DUF4034 domain-containing protein n=1 Tax=Streptomyces brasiliensis TaxID=1954 RepID=A0A917KSX7_9ACTN|nr:hypothetical protein [Streptomyces brasiliensis]GGJ25476.1 hypothetical protein GCM10010121_040720 [Streptomyces brasiliensis]
MVDTMALLRALLRSARAKRTASRPAGPPADDEVLLDAPDERLAPALVAAGRGEYEPAAKLLATTREAAEWEHRDRYLLRLAAFARSRPEWVGQWRAAAPDDPDVLLLLAQLAVDRGWASPARADLLAEALPLITAAAGADPRDPVPWRVALDHACGTDAGHAEFERLWAEAVRRSPHHYGCHMAALRHLCATASASYGECFDFAESAAQDAPAYALVQALPVHAAYTCLARGTEVAAKRLDLAADRGLALSARFPAGDPWPAEVRNLLAYVLVSLGRRQDALGQLRLIGPYVTSFPWDLTSDDPLGHFLRLYEDLAAPGTGLIPSPRGPRNEHGGHAAARDH